eukprot:GHVU01074675.1.p2 GENE.GHVU01074675.1~~GHVU01074675.1.p2  ORF type:complete len:102 (-),score=6.19 GHVU01074675.1:81-386(-)
MCVCVYIWRAADAAYMYTCVRVCVRVCVCVCVWARRAAGASIVCVCGCGEPAHVSWMASMRCVVVGEERGFYEYVCMHALYSRVHAAAIYHGGALIGAWGV